MKLYKKELNKLCVVKWKDAKGIIRGEMNKFIKDGFAVNVTVGWLKYFDSDKIVMASEFTVGDDEVFDLNMIPRDWIEELKFVEE